MSMLGPGVQVATPLSQRTNLRFGFNMFNYNRTFDKDGISYRGQMNWRSAEAHLDWFPFGGGFHFSPGALAESTGICEHRLVPFVAFVPTTGSFSLLRLVPLGTGEVRAASSSTPATFRTTDSR